MKVKGRNAVGVVRVKCGSQGEEFSGSCENKVWYGRFAPEKLMSRLSLFLLLQCFYYPK